MVSQAGLRDLNTDWEWFNLAQNGDQNAWRRLIERHAPGLTRMAFLVTGSSSVAQDLVQDSFIELIRWRPGHRKGSFKAYLSTAVYHRALKEVKRSRAMSSLDRVDLEDSAVSPLDGVVSEERDRAIAGVIGSLDRDHRDILILRFYGGHSYMAIAEMTGLSLGTVKSRIFYAVKTCRNRLKEKGWIE